MIKFTFALYQCHKYITSYHLSHPNLMFVVILWCINESILLFHTLRSYQKCISESLSLCLYILLSLYFRQKHTLAAFLLLSTTDLIENFCEVELKSELNAFSRIYFTSSGIVISAFFFSPT